MASRLAILGTVAVLAICTSARGQCHYLVTEIPVPICPPFGSPTITTPLALSDSGEVVGWYNSCSDGDNVAFRWSVESGFDSIDLGLDHDDWGELISVNSDGLVAGNVSQPGMTELAFVMPDPQHPCGAALG